jgi:hypothetical protein
MITARPDARAAERDGYGTPAAMYRAVALDPRPLVEDVDAVRARALDVGFWYDAFESAPCSMGRVRQTRCSR